MNIMDEGEVSLSTGAMVGRIVAKNRSSGDDYLSLFVYGAPGFLGAVYTSFFLHHAPRALVRSSTAGFLLRVESFVGASGAAAAEARCADFVAKVLPSCQELVNR